MKVCVIQPPYSMKMEEGGACFEKILEYLRDCDDSLDLIVLPEYSDVPCRADRKEDLLRIHDENIHRLLGAVRETAIRCKALVFVNALSQTESGWRNTTYAYDREGALIGQYFKRHLPPSEMETLELDHGYIDGFSPPYVLEHEGVRYAFLTCYDFYFYEAFAAIARQKADVIIGCSLQRSDTHAALEIMGRFLCYNTNAYLVRASVSLGEDSPLCGSSMVVAPDGEVLLNMKSRAGLGITEIDPGKKYYKPAGFGGKTAAHYEYIEYGRRPWNYRPAGPAMVPDNGRMGYPRICAHQGFNSIAPNNSLPAFGAAVAMGAQEIEFDLWYTKDGEIVSIHDPVVDRLSDGTGKVYEHTYEELLQYDFGFKRGEAFRGMRILRFEEILKKFACQVIMNVHIKERSSAPYPEEIFRRIVALIDRYDCRGHVYFMGNEPVMALAAKYAPDIGRCMGEEPAVIRGERSSRLVERALACGCQKIQLFKPFFTEETIRTAHEKGLKVNLFWSDDPEEAAKYVNMGVDTVLTNDYHRIAAALNI